MNERLSFLFKKQRLQELSAAEQMELFELMADQTHEAQVSELLRSHWDNFEPDQFTPTFQQDRVEELMDTLLTVNVHPFQPSVKKIRLWSRIAGAVAVLTTLLSIGLYLSTNRDMTLGPQASNHLGENIVPARRGATLTLANGKMIQLSDATNGELAEDAGIVITKSANGKLIYEVKNAAKDSNGLNTISTPKGETYEVRLPDGTVVLLNAASKLTFATHLIQQGKRLVRLEGEGYFEVVKDRVHPFIVKGRGQEVEVLGTHFNMNTYADEPLAATTLLEGAVQVTSGKEKKKIKPGEQAISNGITIQTGKADIEQVMSWTKGDFYLNHVNFKAAMRDIARWYDVEVVYDASVPNDMESGGWIARDKPLAVVLKSIESSGLVRFKVEGRKIYVKP